VRPGAAGALGQPLTVSAAEMNRLPIVQFLGKRAMIEESTWFSRYGGDAYPWLGTIVYDGQVYDHIHHRARGGVWRYSMVKNMWKFDFNRGHDFEARDNWGRKFAASWTKLNLEPRSNRETSITVAGRGCSSPLASGCSSSRATRAGHRLLPALSLTTPSRPIRPTSTKATSGAFT
jgi:hypothetical protein